MKAFAPGDLVITPPLTDGARPGAIERKQGQPMDRTTLFENFPNILTAVSTAVIAAFTVVLARVGRRQAGLMIAIEGPAPVIDAIKLVEYTDIAGPAVLDPVPPGPIPKFCRVLPEIYNLGRTPAHVTQFSLQWAVSQDLPEAPGTTILNRRIFELSEPHAYG